MFRSLLIVAALCVLSSSAAAQIIYEPVQYQFGSKEKYYYGGRDPMMKAFLSRGECRFDHRGDQLARAYPLRVYSDCVPYDNAALYGYTPADAMNDANANAPTYFRKIDLLRSAHQTEDGTFVVPATAPCPHGSIEIKPFVRPERVAPATQPSRRQILIFPKDLLDKKLGPSDKRVASAD